MSLYRPSVLQTSKMLNNLAKWLDDAEAYAKQRGFDVETLLLARLAPDQFTLTRQIQSACDSAKLAAARLGQVEAPVHADDEKTLAELRARITSTLDFLASLRPEAFDGAEDRDLSLRFLPGKLLRGEDYFWEFGQPNFYFHVVTAYSILRHNGVPLGKMPFIGGMTMRDA